ncbi:hypothetical protein AS189_17410 [Arthrobacter alpinus]|uniref:Uncharacterized protein n=1 Tax=Arthrobacter alpinus TaxID=656366 RepID=A0A0S2M2T5_9MICC|nr:DUF6308 family protein [Arthrobacter alpinus]ALO67937.1 hypothetical protein AS189_17410 [Arthrobacter alpinus]
MKLPKILDSAHVEQAAALVNEYYTKTYKRGEVQTGARFESWMGGGDASEVVNTITADDLIAVTFLSVDVPAPAAIGILETHKDKISELLEQIPSDLDLAKVSAEDFASTLGTDSAAVQLWRLLRQSDAEWWGIGQTRASKIMARKRPRLIPIYDSVVGPLMGLKNSNKQWSTWHELLTDGSGLPERLKEIQEKSAVAPDASALRIMDVVLWKHGKNLATSKSGAGHRD